MPDAGNFSHLLDYLSEMDYCKTLGMGIVPLSITDINDWAVLTNIRLNTFELLSITQLSRLYVCKYNEFDRTNASDPTGMFYPENKDKVSNSIKNALRSMKVDYG